MLWTCVGSLDDGSVFDSTRGDTLKYRDGGFGVFRPVVIRLSGYPQPGICVGLQEALVGMKIGGRRTVKVPSTLGFGDQVALAPYGIVPSGSTVTYDIELLRVSSVGPDLLMKVGCGSHLGKFTAVHT
jgi:FKBP-type peptidyl-prolyl cis-trans isomerase